jgi:acyl-CoA thioesterase I
MPPFDKTLFRAASDTPSRLRYRRRASKTSVAAGPWLLLLGLLTAATACADFKSGNASENGGTKAKGGAAGATAAQAGGTPSTQAGGASSQAGAAAGGASAGDGGATAATGGAAAGDGGATAATGGSGGCSGLTGGSAGATTPSCTMPAKWVGALTKPSPLVSLGKPVMTNSTEQANKGLLVDGKYKVSNGLVFSPTATSSTWASIDVGTGYAKLLLVWKDVGSTDYAAPTEVGSTTDYSLTSGSFPTAYLIKTSSDSTNGDDGTWTTAATVTGNAAPARSHVVDFTGMRWVRFEVTATAESAAGVTRVARIDELELHDISAVGPSDLSDSWFIMGDSITKMSFDRARQANEIDKALAAQRPAYAPAVVEAGIGYEKLSDALRHLQTEPWLKNSEGLTFVTLAYGTNDSWGGTTPTAAGFETTMRSVIKALTDAGRIPVLARIPWNTVSTSVPQFNAVIDKLQQEFQLPCGPDLYGLVAAHPDYVGAVGTVQPNCTIKYSGTDGVHPQSPAAKNAIHKAYVDALLPLYPSP